MIIGYNICISIDNADMFDNDEFSLSRLHHPYCVRLRQLFLQFADANSRLRGKVQYPGIGAFIII